MVRSISVCPFLALFVQRNGPRKDALISSRDRHGWTVIKYAEKHGATPPAGSPQPAPARPASPGNTNLSVEEVAAQSGAARFLKSKSSRATRVRRDWTNAQRARA